MTAAQCNDNVASADCDEQWYQSMYPDVARAIREGRVLSAYDHYIRYGVREGRRAPPGAVWPRRETATDHSSQAAQQSSIGPIEALLPTAEENLSKSPRTSRELLELFSEYDEHRGMSSVLDKIDANSCELGQIYWSVLSRWPHPSDYRDKAELNARDVFKALLLSHEFQSDIVRRVLEAYPEKRRFLFVHVPKCAGTDLEHILSKALPSIHQTLSIEAWTSQERLFSVLHHLVRRLERANGLFVCGHHTLQWFMNNDLHRFNDRLFTIIRDPFDRVLSHINYIVTRLDTDRHAALTDTRQWLTQLGIAIPVSLDLEQLAFRVMRQANLITRNGLCAQFGEASCIGALANLTRSEIEITELSRYNEWLSDTWGINSVTRANQSKPIFARQSIEKEDRDWINSLIAEDLQLYAAVKSKLDQSDRSFVRGIELG